MSKKLIKVTLRDGKCLRFETSIHGEEWSLEVRDGWAIITNTFGEKTVFPADTVKMIETE